jgi:hypothetical protein
MAVSNVGYAIGAKSNKWLGQFGVEPSIEHFFIFAGVVLVLPMLLLFGLDPDSVAAKRHAEDKAELAALRAEA